MKWLVSCVAFPVCFMFPAVASAHVWLQKAAVAATSATTTQLKAALPSPPAKGNVVVVIACSPNHNRNSAFATMPGGEFYHLGTSFPQDCTVSAFAAPNVAGGPASQTATVFFVQASTYNSVIIVEYPPCSVNLIDGSYVQNNVTAATSANSGAVGATPTPGGQIVPTAYANGVILAAFCNSKKVTTNTTFSAPTNGFAIVDQSGPACLCEKRQTAPGAQPACGITTATSSATAGLEVVITQKQPVDISVAPWEKGVTVSWTSHGQTPTDTITIISSATPDMANPTTVVSGQALAFGSTNVTLSPVHWNHRYYQAQAVNAASGVDAKSPVIVGVNNPKSTLLTGVETLGYDYDGYKPGDLKTKIGLGAGIVIARPNAAADCHAAGIPLMVYNTWYQQAPTVAGQDNKTNAQLQADVGNILYDGASDNTGFKPTRQSIGGRYIPCDNSTAWIAIVAAWITRTLDNGGQAGIQGLWIDNGYTDPAAPLSSQLICQSPFHTHQSAGLTQAQTYMGMCLKAVCILKQAQANALYGLNDMSQKAYGIFQTAPNTGIYGDETRQYFGLHLSDMFDMFVWEGFLCNVTTKSPLPEEKWHFVYNQAQYCESYNSNNRAQITLLSYPKTKSDAYFCYASAKLCNLAVAQNIGEKGGLNSNGHFGFHPAINNLKLGKPIANQTGGLQYGSTGCYYRDYAKGFVVVNPTDKPVTVTLTESQKRKRTDELNQVDLDADTTTYTIPAHSGNVFRFG